MNIKPFKLERYFAKYEFTAPYLLCSSDCEALTMDELTIMSDSDSLQLWYDLKLAYTESQGHPILREEISQMYTSIKPDDVLVLTPEEGIYIAMNTLLNKGDHVITSFPAYQSLYEIANSIGCELSQWTPKEKDAWVFDVSDLKAMIKENTKLIVINFPHNPTGAIICEDELKQIIALCKQHNIILFSDEMYRFLEYDPADRTTSACDLYENAVSLFGMSKSFALAGLRIGWLATKNKNLLNKFITYKDYTTICNSAPSEILAIMGLRAKDHILERNLNLIHENLTLLDLFFNDYEELFYPHRPKAGPIAFPKLSSEIKVEDFCKDLIEKKGVMLLPANQYDFKVNNFRIGFARKNMPEALAKLEEYIKEIL